MPRFSELGLVLILEHIYCGIPGKSCVSKRSSFFSGFGGRAAPRDPCGGDRGALGCPRSRSTAALEGLYARTVGVLVLCTM